MALKKEEHKEERNKDEQFRFDADRPLTSFRDAMNRIFEEGFNEPWQRIPARFRGGGFFNFPRVDISETDTDIKVTADIPGIDPEKVEIDVRDDRLILSGKTAREEEEKGEKFYRYERQSGEFKRQVMLPAKVDTDNVKAKAKNGVLIVTLPKAEPEKRKKIKVEIE